MSKMKSYIFDLFDDNKLTVQNSERIQDAEFWTTDRDAYLSFGISRQGFVINKAIINLYNKSDKTLLIDEPMTILNNEARFKMPSDVMSHFGKWSVQVIFNEVYTSPAVDFDILRALGSGIPDQIGLIHEWEKLNNEVKAFVAEIEGFTLEEFVALKMGEELANLEVNYAKRLTGLERKDNELATQLAQKASKKTVGLSVDDFPRLELETDDTNRLVRAITAIKNIGGILNIDSSLTINGSINETVTEDLHIIAKPGVVIDGRNSTEETLIQLNGSRDMAIPLLSDANKYDTSIFADVPVKEGDIILIQSTELFNPTRNYYFKGEMVEVDEVINNTIKLKAPLYDSYNASATVVRKLVMPKITVSNLTIKRNSNHGGLGIRFARDILLNNLSISGARERSINLSSIFGGMITNCHTSDSWYSGSGTSYGIAIVSCQNLNMYGGRYLGGRHGITIGGEFPNRHINVDGVFASSKIGTNTAGFDCHGNCEFINVVNSCLTGDSAIKFEGAGVNISNNTLIGVGSNRSTVLMSLEIGDESYINIDKNTIISKEYIGIEIRPYNNNLTYDRITLERNSINTKDMGVFISPTSEVLGVDFYVAELINRNNKIDSIGNSFVISKNSSNLIKCKSLVVDGGETSETISLELTNDSDVLITGGVNLNTDLQNGYGVFILNAGNITLNNFHVKGRDIENFSSTMMLQCANNVNITNGIIENFRNFKGIDTSGLLIPNTPIPKRLLINNIEFVNVSGDIRSDLTTIKAGLILETGFDVMTI